jgi:hypothetical protein
VGADGVSVLNGLLHVQALIRALLVRLCHRGQQRLAITFEVLIVMNEARGDVLTVSRLDLAGGGHFQEGYR